MKSLVSFFLFAFLSSSWLLAQSDKCFEFFPTKKGATLVNKSYDASNNLICTTTYKVNKYQETSSGASMEVAYTLTDSNGKTIDNGVMKPWCDRGIFYMNLSNKAFKPDVIKMLGTEVELIGDLLDYPDVFGSSDASFKDEANFTIQSKKDKKKFISIKVSERKHEKNEPLMVPAGNYYASKVTFNLEAKNDKTITKYKCIEWYAPDAGVIRSETYDANGNLFRYNVLTSISGN